MDGSWWINIQLPPTLWGQFWGVFHRLSEDVHQDWAPVARGSNLLFLMGTFWNVPFWNDPIGYFWNDFSNKFFALESLAQEKFILAACMSRLLEENPKYLLGCKKVWRSFFLSATQKRRKPFFPPTLSTLSCNPGSMETGRWRCVSHGVNPLSYLVEPTFL